MRDCTDYRAIVIASSICLMASGFGPPSTPAVGGGERLRSTAPSTDVFSRFDVIPARPAVISTDCPDQSPSALRQITSPKRGGMELTLRAPAVKRPPRLDGSNDDDAWLGAPIIETTDATTGRRISLAAVHTATDIFFLARFDDDAPSLAHRTWRWNTETRTYESSWDVQDVLTFKWSMSGYAVDLGLARPTPHRADVWVWQACRTDPAGYMDDGMHVIDTAPRRRDAHVTSPLDAQHYLHELNDAGTAAFQEIVPDAYVGDCQTRYLARPASDSRGDVRAVGRWEQGRWTIEIGRALRTRHRDDLTFEVGGTYLFAVACSRMRGAAPDPRLSQPLYHTGDAFDRLLLKVQPDSRPTGR